LSKSNPLVSIITPSYNQARFLEETIRSVLSQEYPHIEYLIGTADRDAVGNHPALLSACMVGPEPDRGQTEAINKGLSMRVKYFLAKPTIHIAGAVDSREYQAILKQGCFMAMQTVDEHNSDRKFCPQTDYRRLRAGLFTSHSIVSFVPVCEAGSAADPGFIAMIMTQTCSGIAPLGLCIKLWRIRLHGECNPRSQMIAGLRCRVHFETEKPNLSVAIRPGCVRCTPGFRCPQVWLCRRYNGTRF
jgi:hypothetical protein